MPLVGKKRVIDAIDKHVSDVDKTLRGFIFQTLASIQIGTPRDTGLAANNWFLTLDSPSSDVTASINGNAVKVDQLPRPIGGETIYFTNNLPYINRLEYDGWSDQASAGWVRVEMLKLQVAVKSL